MKRTLALFFALIACNDTHGATSSPDLAGPPMVTGVRPPARKDVDGVLANGAIYVYGGDEAPASTAIPAPKQLVDELWHFDPAKLSWDMLMPAGTSAGPRGGYAATWDSMRNRILVFGGRLGTDSSPPLVNDLWQYDVAKNEWKQLAPTGTPPAARVGHRMVYDAGKDRVILYGGDTSKVFGNGIVGETWELAFSGGSDGAWTQIAQTGAPPKRRDAAMAIVSDLKVAVIFGGATSFSDYLNDVWALDLDSNKWRQVAAPGPPSKRFGAKMDRDATGGKLYLFGGHDPTSLGPLNDTWSLALDAGAQNATFTRVLAGDSDVTVDGVDHASPERREKHALVALPGKLWVYGGGGDCGPLDDIWTLDFTAPTKWIPTQPAMIDETCQRRASAGQQCQPPPNDCTAPF
jgi:N-acetylneuraminic acid mutarotase